MLVRLNSIQYITDKHGRQRTHYPGEWVSVGKQLGNSWIATGQAERPDMPDMEALPGCGVVAPPDRIDMVRKIAPGLDRKNQADPPGLPFPRVLWWDPAGASLRPDLVGTGFQLLDTWQAAAPLYSYQTLARDQGDETDRSRTEALVHDLRVPVYESRCLFLRRCQATRDLMAAWAEERVESGRGPENDRLAFLRALYRVKPLVLALPTTWIRDE